MSFLYQGVQIYTNIYNFIWPFGEFWTFHCPFNLLTSSPPLCHHDPFRICRTDGIFHCKTLIFNPHKRDRGGAGWELWRGSAPTGARAPGSGPLWSSNSVWTPLSATLSVYRVLPGSVATADATTELRDPARCLARAAPPPSSASRPAPPFLFPAASLR